MVDAGTTGCRRLFVESRREGIFFMSLYAQRANMDVQREQVRHTPSRLLSRLPYWLLFAFIIALVLLWHISTDDTYTLIFNAVLTGMGMTILVTVVAFCGALILG